MRICRLLIKTALTLIFPSFCVIITGNSQSPSIQKNTIKIGLLVPDDKSPAAQYGAAIAISEANRNGGLNGVPFELVPGYMDGPWGTGSKEAVKLIFDDKVRAILGSHDGRNAHIVEQAAAKAHVVFVSAWSSDPTLSQAFVPWFFNCVPTDRQQAQSICDDILINKKIGKAAVVYDDSYDSKLALKNLIELFKPDDKAELLQFRFDHSGMDPSAIAGDLARSGAECIILFCRPSGSLSLMRHLRISKMTQPLYGSLSIVNENELTDLELSEYEGNIMIPAGNWSQPEMNSFSREYKKMTGRMPGPVASFAYDGMMVLIGAIRDAGTSDREKIQASLKRIGLKGVTGTISFDEKGNRTGPFRLTRVRHGIPAFF